MGHGAELLLFCCVLSGAAACNALTGADALEADDRPTPTSSSTSSGQSSSTTSSSGSSSSSSSASSSSGSTSASSSSGSSSGDGGIPVNDSGPPPGATVVINETFDGTPSCGAGWTVVNGTLSPDGAGGCKLCATSTQGIYIELTATAPKGGSASVEAWVKRPQGTTAPTSVSVTLTASSSTISGSTGITESYTKLSPGKVTAQAGGAITPRIGMSSVAVGDCIILDAVRVIIN